MSSGRYDIVIDQGSDFALQLVLKNDSGPVDLSLYNVRGEIRPSYSSATITATFTCTVTNAAGGTIKIELANATTTGLSPGVYVYDLEIYRSGDTSVSRILQGKATVTAQVTQ
jgi:hypothetical protein